MKKIFYALFSIVLVFSVAYLGTSFYTEISKMVPKEIRISENRIVNSDLMTEKEKQLLNRNLKQNENVLLLYYETNEEVSKEKERLIIGNYTKEEIPYVIFVYNPESQTLKTVSSNKEILEFTDISLENVTSYTEVYKYISEINSKVKVSYVSQHKGILIVCILIIWMYCIVPGIFIIWFLEELENCVCWQEKDGFMYKEGFWEKGYKVKFDPTNEEILAIYANVPVKKGKDYLYIPKKDKKKKGKNKILIKNKDEMLFSYEASTYFNRGFNRVYLDFELRMHPEKIQKMYKYCIEKKDNKNENETEKIQS